MLFESSRIFLRKMTSDDTELYHSWRNDVEVMKSTSTFLDIYHFEETRDFVNHVILGSQSSKSYIIIEKEFGKPIGITSLINVDYKNRNAECIIDIGDKNFWGKGYGAEAMKLLLNYSFLELNMNRLSLRVFSFNDRAISLYEKIGFQYEGRNRESIFREGEWHDIIHMGILQREYINNCCK